MLRIQLASALASGDAAASDRSFKDLVRLVVRGQADSLDMRLAAQSVGVCVAMLESDKARSPIEQRVLDIGRNSMLNSKVRGVEAAFTSAYQSAHERTEVLLNTLDAISRDGFDAVLAQFNTRSAAIKARQAAVDQQKQLTSEIVRNTREQIDQNKADERKLAREIAMLQAQLRQRTPGHPGPKRLPPTPPPPRSFIPVDEFELRTVYEIRYQNGQEIRVPVTREVRRSQYEIDRDRDRIYDRHLSEYSLAQADYARYESNYQEAMRTWEQTDQARRRDLNEKILNNERRRSELQAAIRSFQDEKLESAKELKEKRTEQEQEAFELELMAIALAAAQKSQPESAFRPQHFNMFSWSQERVLLERYAAP